MAFQVDRAPSTQSPALSTTFVSSLESQVDGDEVRSRISLEIGVSVTETGDVADLSFMLPKVCRTEFAMSYLTRDPSVTAWRTGFSWPSPA